MPPRRSCARPVVPMLLHEEIGHMQRRVVVDALLEAWPAYWERRARAFEAARPAPGVYHGRSSRQELRAQWHRLTETAAACRARAEVSPLELVEPEVDVVFGEAP